MKKTIVLILTLATLLCSLTGCMFDREYSFYQPVSEISSIEIVSLKYHGTYYEDFEEILICEIEDIDQFIVDFYKMDYSGRFGPNPSPETPTAIKITYKNGNKEAITPYGRYSSDYRFHGSFSFKEDQFYDLINKYAGEEQRKVEYNFFDRREKIVSIQVVRSGQYLGYWQWTAPTVKFDIKDKDYEGFLKDFAELDCYWNCPPSRLTDYSQAIQITYEDGYSEVIGATGQLKFWIGVTNICPTQGYRIFDEKQLAALIEKYRGIYEQEVESSDTEEITSDTEEVASDTEETVSDTTDTSLS